MIALNERYITDADGKRIGVILDIATFERMVELLEDMDDVRAYDAAKAALADDELIPLDQAIAELEAEWAAEHPER